MRSEIFLLIVGMTIVTYLTRYSPLLLFRSTGVPGWVEEWMKPIPVAVLTALIVPSLFLQEGILSISLENHYLVAGIAAALIAWKTRNILLTLGLSMALIVGLRFL